MAITTVSLALLVSCTAQAYVQVSGQPSTDLSQSVIGYDVSYPQCGRSLPSQAAFGVVGLNGTLAKNFNPCFQTEARWTEHATNSTDMPKLSIYVHVANPGSTAPNWPTTGINSDGICTGGNTTSCSYQYGEILAKDDIAHLAAEEVNSYPMVFMDVEDNYSWQTIDLNNNTAVMEGMTATFKAAGDTVGIYSDTKQWMEIVGNLTKSSSLNGLPDWVLGGYSLATAQHNCTSHSFTGTVILTQLAGPNYPVDEDFSCVV
jgi:hypothetical protein